MGGTAVDQPAVLGRPEDMTPDWFTDVLRSAGMPPSCVVREVRLSPIGAGALARAVRAELTYDGTTQGPSSLVVKYATEDAGSLGMAAGLGMYIRETRFYRDVAPIITAPVPRSFLAATDDEGRALSLVLEDLTAYARPGDSMQMATSDEVSAAISALAQLQAATWNSNRLHKLAWLADRTPVRGMFDALSQGLNPFLARFADSVSAEHRALYSTIVPRAGDWVRGWSGDAVLQHGDYRMDNLMFGLTPNSPPATIIDFQTVRLGPPGVDLSYLVGTALSTEDRRADQRELVERYHAELQAAGVRDHDFETCWRGYCEGSLYGVLLLVGMAGRVESTPRLDVLLAEQTARYADMALDLDAAAVAGLA